jgi:hypothetical protein
VARIQRIDIDSELIRKIVRDFSNSIRAEKALVGSFLDTYADPSAIKRITNVNNQIIYGRRGTGKTHLMFALAEMLQEESDKGGQKQLPIYIDLRKILPLITEQEPDSFETSVLIFKHIIDEIISNLVNNLKYILDITSLKQQPIEKEKEIHLIEQLKKINIEFDGQSFKRLGKITLSQREIQKIAGSIRASKSPEISAGKERSYEEGKEQEYTKYISFSQISEILGDISDSLGGLKIYCLIDEWSELPMNLQPYVSELLKRSFIASNYVLKIAAIPYRSKFQENFDEGKRIGLEEGGDVFPITLDDRYIFEIDKTSTRDFYNELLLKHLTKIDPRIMKLFNDRKKRTIEKNFINQFFTNHSLSEILVASAGIPRDFINLFINSFENKTIAKRISLKNVRKATSEWYCTDKKEEVEKDPTIKRLFEGIVGKVIIEKKSTHFLIPKKFADNKHIKKLIDLRVLHLRKEGISHKYVSKRVYNVYSIDYGSYTSLDIAKRTLDTNLQQLVMQLDTIDDIREARAISLEDDFFEQFMLDIGEGIKCKKCTNIVDTNHPAYIKKGLCNHCFEDPR